MTRPVYNRVFRVSAASLCRAGLLSFAALMFIMRATSLLAQETIPKTEEPLQTAAPLNKLKGVLPLKVTVTTDKKMYAVGTPIKMTMLVKNATEQPVQLRFSSGQRFDFVLRAGTRPDGKIIWQWARGHMFTMMVTSEKLEPGKTLTFAAAYDPTPAQAPIKPITPLSAGVYTLTATLTTMGTEPRAFGTTHIKVK